MIRNGLNKISPKGTDYSLLHSLKAGAIYGATLPDPKGLPENYSNYSGQAIPHQDFGDARFTPPLPPLYFGCTGETGAFDAGIQDGTLYNPEDLYLHTKPGNPNTGRDIRDALQTLIDRGPMRADGTMGPKRTAYFNCYGAGKIDDFDAARIALWINQGEKRNVWAGTWWYEEFNRPDKNGVLPLPSFNTAEATLHCHLIIGWKSIAGVLYLEDISWQGEDFAAAGLAYISREEYNALMAQPYTGAFTESKLGSNTPVPIGLTAIIDHLVYFITNLFGISPLQKKTTI